MRFDFQQLSGTPVLDIIKNGILWVGSDSTLDRLVTSESNGTDSNGYLINTYEYRTVGVLVPNTDVSRIGINQSTKPSVQGILRATETERGYHFNMATNGVSAQIYKSNVYLDFAPSWTALSGFVELELSHTGTDLVLKVYEDSVLVHTFNHADTDPLPKGSSGFSVYGDANVFLPSYENELPEPVIVFNTVPPQVNNRDDFIVTVTVSDDREPTLLTDMTIDGHAVTIKTVKSLGTRVFELLCNIPKYTPIIHDRDYILRMEFDQNSYGEYQVRYQVNDSYKVTQLDSLNYDEGSTLKDYTGDAAIVGDYIIHQANTNILNQEVIVQNNGIVFVGANITQNDNFSRYHQSQDGTIGNEAIHHLTLDSSIVTPVITSNPTSGSLIEGNSESTHTLTVTANDADTYQLQVFNGVWSDVNGATTSSTTLNGQNFTVSDNGKKYRYKVTSSTNTSVYSSEAVITVVEAVEGELAIDIVSFHGYMLQLELNGALHDVRFDSYMPEDKEL